ncbi:GM130 [Drosophila busckii]|uniref:GM130 n=1 Tax=Drosophila busckii TaxID=30019 RepID=A0A0M3QUD5_DROBS|nr:golgin subfamily A member 2 [Drosophila busckii]ALC40473.1 GM130 [Drosophila busckii]
MPDDTPDAKAQKLAAARKKLKEYQQRNNNNVDENAGTNTNSSTVSISSNVSEHSDCELNNAGAASGSAQQTMEFSPSAASAANDVAAYFTQPSMPQMEAQPMLMPTAILSHNGQGDTNLQTIQVLIAEKAQLNTDLTKWRHLCRQHELELEEVRTEHSQAGQRVEQLQQHAQELQRSAEQQRNTNAELQHKLALSQAQIEDQRAHLSEVEAQLKQLTARQDELQQQLTDKCNELDMALLKLRQLSDESHVNTDNRVETLTQTQYMYEQQIRDLQQMVAQLTQDKEQASLQYQNYVGNLNERNSELSEECTQLRERERQLVEHVSSLERDIQKNLALQAQYKEQAASQLAQQQPKEQPAMVQDNAELVALKERLSDFDFERHEFQLKIKSQHDQLQLKDETIGDLEQQLQRLQTEQPDQVKLLATMESDKVAASRALTQNVEMKKQLDELELRFVQLTNDKAELVNKLDAEEFANREIRSNYSKMEQQLQANDERYKFKDEEMIRLSHENVELQRMQLVLKQQLDRLQHYEAQAYHNHASPDAAAVEEGAAEAKEVHEQHDHNHEHDHDHHDHDHNHEGHDHHNHNHHHHHHHQHSEEHGTHSHNESSCKTPLLPSAEAVEKLQSRFTKLISQVADLTEEKHSLEHLVLQLQSETETIGEYIALYQTQRRMLKQREYEKATQMRLLQAERAQLREKIETLNKLVGSLGVVQPTEQPAAIVNGTAEQQTTVANESTESANSQQILYKIQDIITEIKVNTEESPNTAAQPGGHAVDHLNCCLGKFEVV